MADDAREGASPEVIARPRNTFPTKWLDEIESMILRAEAPADFVPVLAKQWQRTPRQVWRYVAKVRARLVERAKAHDPDADRELVRALLLNAYRTAEVGSADKGPDAKGMVAAAKTLADVTGAAPPKKVDVTSGGASIKLFLPDET